MPARRPRRWLAPAAVLILVGGALAAALHVIGPPAAAPILGVVHETEIHISSEMNARLGSFPVHPGQALHKGDVIAVLTAPELAAAVEEAKAAVAAARADRDNVRAGLRPEQIDIAAQDVRIAEANLMLAQQRYARAASLASRDVASKQQLDESTAAVQREEASLAVTRAAYAEGKAGPTREARANAEARVGLAAATLADRQARLSRTVITAPVDGVVGLLAAEPEEVVRPGKVIMTLAVANERWVSFTIREDRLNGLTVGTPVALATAGRERIRAHVTEVRPLGEFATWRAARAVGDHDINSFFVRADLDGETPALEPGMTVWLDRPIGAGD